MTKLRTLRSLICCKSREKEELFLKSVGLGLLSHKEIHYTYQDQTYQDLSSRADLAEVNKHGTTIVAPCGMVTPLTTVVFRQKRKVLISEEIYDYEPIINKDHNVL